MSRFTETMYANAQSSRQGLVTGEPGNPVRHTWAEVHERARRIAGGLAQGGIGRGDAVAVLAGAPVEIAPTAQGIWMRGGSLTMLHQPTPRTDLQRWATDTTGVIEMIDKRLSRLSDALGDKAYLDGGRFTAGDLMMTTVLRIIDGKGLLDRYSNLVAYKARCQARPAFQAALAAQIADFEAREPVSA